MESRAIFTTGGALQLDYPYYVARHGDYAAWRALSQGKLIYTIAPRQMGKTSLLKRLANRMKRERWHCCTVDLATMRNLDRSRWFQNFGTTIAWSCNITRIRSPLRDQQDFRTFLLDEIGLRSITPEIKLALFLDEVEGLFGLNFSDDFLMTLRDLYQQRDIYSGQLAIAFAGAADPATLVKDPAISPFNIAEEIVLNDFSAAESFELTSRLSLKDVPVDASTHDRIYEWASGHPYLTQRICECIEQDIDLGRITHVTTDVVDQTLTMNLLGPRTLDKNIKHVLQEITNPAVPLPKIWNRVLAGDTVYATEPGFYRLYLSGVVFESPSGQVNIRNNAYRLALGLDPTISHSGEVRQEHQHAALTRPAVLNSGKAWAVLVGINTYEDSSIADLSVCVDDVTAIQCVIAPTYQSTQLLTDAVTDGTPTRANILAVLATMAQAASEHDLLLFYFSGHGIADAGESYLLPCDARLSALKHTALAMGDLRELLDGSAARSKVIILDACHSGVALGKATSLMSPDFIQRVFAEAEGMAVLSSCKQGQRSWEWPMQNQSVFTYYLLEALLGQADLLGKGFVTVSDVSAYVTDRVKTWSVEHRMPQTPTLQYAVAGDIVLNQYQARDSS